MPGMAYALAAMTSAAKLSQMPTRRPLNNVTNAGMSRTLADHAGHRTRMPRKPMTAGSAPMTVPHSPLLLLRVSQTGSASDATHNAIAVMTAATAIHRRFRDVFCGSKVACSVMGERPSDKAHAACVACKDIGY